MQRHAAAGGAVLGVCGGLQMLGRHLHDPEGHDGQALAQFAGLGLLDLDTYFGADKRVQAARVRFAAPTGPWAALAGVAAAGYEIRCGQTQAAGATPVLFDADGQAIGWQQGRVLGVYAHGLFEDAAVLHALFGAAAPTPHEAFERLADAVQEALDPALVRRVLGA